MKKIFLVYSHYDEKSFNAAIRDTFVSSLKELGHTVDYVDLYKDCLLYTSPSPRDPT